MKLNFVIDTDELYGEDGVDFEHLLTDSLKREIVKNAKNNVASEKFKEFSRLASDTLVAEIKLKLENFLSEEIALTENWGKPTFVGSIEDLIKKRFDDVLLRPVDSSGKTLQGCTSSSKTWIEWRIENRLDDNLKQLLDNAANQIERTMKSYVDKKIIEIKDSALKQQVDAAFTAILTKT